MVKKVKLQQKFLKNKMEMNDDHNIYEGFCLICNKNRVFVSSKNRKHMTRLIDFNAIVVECKVCGWKWFKKLPREYIRGNRRC